MPRATADGGGSKCRSSRRPVPSVCKRTIAKATWRPPGSLCELLVGCGSGSALFRYPCFYDPRYQTSGSFHESELVGQAALDQHADSVIAGQVRCGRKRDKFANAKMGEVTYFRQDI